MKKRKAGAPSMHKACVRNAAVMVAASMGWVAGALATPIYASIAADGTQRYSTQPLDASYRPIAQEPAPDADATARGSRPLDALADSIARKHGVQPALVRAIIAVESNHRATAVSPKGAVGAMQLMPETAARYGVGRSALRDPGANIEAGVRHLKELLDEHHGNVALALAAYNSGAGAVRRHGNRIPPFRETMLYVPAVLAKSAHNTAQ